MAIGDPFDWGATATALGQSHAPDRPTDGKIAAGYQDGEVIPAEEFNWLAFLVGAASRAATRFTDLGTLIDNLAAGETGILVEDTDGANKPGSQHTAVAVAPGTGVESVDCGGNIVVWWGESFDYVVWDDRGLGDSAAGGTASHQIAVSYTPVTDIRRVITDGAIIVVAYETAAESMVEAFDLDGVQLWEFEIPGNPAIHDICMDGTNVYVTHASDSGTKTVSAIARASTNPVTRAWTFNHGATCYSVATDGTRVFVTAASSGGINLFALRSTDGAIYSTDPYTCWAALGPTHATGGGRLACDGRYLYIAYPQAAPHQLEVRGCADGVVVKTRTYADPSSASSEIRSIAVDHELLIVGMYFAGPPQEVGHVAAFRTSDLGVAWRNADSIAGPTYRGVRCVATDGAAVFVGSVDTLPDRSLRRLYRGNRPGLWTRVDEAGAGLPMAQLAIPLTG